jgi:2,3-diketo-5-methylthio-1-phosphopentane phosphatase
MNKSFKIFTDFDGTVAKKNVGELLFRTFDRHNLAGKIIQDFNDGKITSRQCWTQLCDCLDSVNIDELESFILKMEIDPGFHKFVNYCNEHDFILMILSDGFDYYIEKILLRENLGSIKFYSNSLTITTDGRLVPSFPYFDESCLYSANCKRNHILENSGENDFTVFIGDGNSDRDTIEYADFIFAKDDLLKYCEKQRITYFPFNNFYDVLKKLDELNSKRKLKKKHQAFLKRREAYLAEY